MYFGKGGLVLTEDGDSAERSRKLLRLYKRYLGDKNAEEFLLEAGRANAFDGNSEQQRVLSDMLLNFSEFSNAVERSFADYEDRLSLATRNLEISSEELTDALSDLERLNSNINLMLESLDEGLFFFNNEGVCSDVYSESCIELIGEVPTGKTLPYVLNFNNDATQSFYSWLKIVFSGFSAMDFDDLKALLPNEIINSNRDIIELDYKPMYMYGDELSGVLVIAKDVTFQREARQQMQDMQNESMRIKKMAQDRDGLREFLLDCSSFVTMIDELAQALLKEEDITLLKRTVHTFKGMAATFHLLDLQDACHEFENYLDRTKGDVVTKACIIDNIKPFKDVLEIQKSEAIKIFGATYFNQTHHKTVDAHLFDELMAHVKALDFDEGAKKSILGYIADEFLSETIESEMQTFKREINRLCELYGKEMPEFDCKGCDIKVNSEKYKEFFKSLIHLARNVADHALEKSSERIVAGKTPQGTVKIHAAVKDDMLHIEISDDGRGIDPDMIRKKLLSKGFDVADNLSDEAILEYIFAPDFSSKDTIDMTSGRGIGMNVIKEVVLSHGGIITVDSRFADNNGTTFKIALPYS